MRYFRSVWGIMARSAAEPVLFGSAGDEVSGRRSRDTDINLEESGRAHRLGG
jgi:hypothetical protein